MRVAWITATIFVYIVGYLADLWYCGQSFGPGMSSVTINQIMFWQQVSNYSGSFPVDIVKSPLISGVVDFFGALFTIITMNFAMFSTDWGWWIRLFSAPFVATAIIGLIYGFLMLIQIVK